MLKNAIRDWYRSLARATGANSGTPAAAITRPTAYLPSPWFQQNWKLLSESNRDALKLEDEAGGTTCDPAELECLNAAICYLGGDFDGAHAHVTTALTARPDFAQAYVQRARLLRAAGEHRAALANFVRATALVPDDAQTLVEQAQQHLGLDERAEAFDCYQLAVAHAPNSGAGRLGLARMMREGGDAQAALEQIRHALRAQPHNAELHFESALLHGRCNDLARAIAAYDYGLRLEPDNFSACANCGLMYLNRIGDPETAQRYFERAITLNKDSIEVRANLGLALEQQGRVDAALAYYAGLIAAFPAVNEYRWNRGLASLASGDYERGWLDYELRHARGPGTSERAFPFPQWDGTQLRDGAALLVFAEQGLGDEIMFGSCLPDLVARGIDCVIECDVRLAGILARSFPNCRIHGAPRDGDRRWLANHPQIQVQCAIGSLPRWLRRSSADFPAHPGYLKADPARVTRWQARLAHLSPGYRVGLAWRGGTASTRGDLRSIPPTELSPLFSDTRLAFVSLQRDGGDALASGAEHSAASLMSFGNELNDIEELAALMTALDHIVTVDNTVAHLSGALGCNTSIMLSHCADWRWLRNHSRSPWYPSVKLFRQAVSRDWSGVVGEVAGHLSRPA